ncbi:hypothetical protein KI387_018697, partial [Taxus chinensis]
MASLLTYTSTFSPCNFKHPPSTISSQISQHLHFDTNSHNPEKRHSKNIIREGTNAVKDLKFSTRSNLLFASTKKGIVALGTGTAIFFTLAFTRDCYAAGIESQAEAIKVLIAEEPKNALSLPTWAIHVSSVVEWMAAMALVWQYGNKPGYQAWKGLSWGMVPLLGGALCACTWHFFYNAESLE